MTTRKELVEALRLRYRSAAFSDRIKILDEFVALTCYHCKHAIRVLRGELSPATEVRQRNRVHDEAFAQALTVLLEAADRVCGKRLKPLIVRFDKALRRDDAPLTLAERALVGRGSGHGFSAGVRRGVGQLWRFGKPRDQAEPGQHGLALTGFVSVGAPG